MRSALRLRRMRPAVALALMLCLAVTAAGCAVGKSGHAVADQQALNDRDLERFDVWLNRADRQIDRPRNEKSTIYWFGQVGQMREQFEIDLVWYQNATSNDPDKVAYLARSRTSKSSKDNLDRYHPSGSPREYLLLGERYRDLAPTPWVSYPVQVSADEYICGVVGMQVLCAVSRAIESTSRSHPEKLVREVVDRPDGGVELRTGITVEAMDEDGVLALSKRVRKAMPRSVFDKLLPTTLVFDRTGRLRKVSVNGTLRAGGEPVKFQIGYEYNRQSTPRDFPPEPSAFDVTDLPDGKARDAFYDKLFARQT